MTTWKKEEDEWSNLEYKQESGGWIHWNEELKLLLVVRIDWIRDGTWPPTTAMEGKASQRVGRALSSPWSPSAVHALCILFTNEIKVSIARRNADLMSRFWSAGEEVPSRWADESFGARKRY